MSNDKRFKVSALRQSDITPTIVLNSLNEQCEAGKISEIYAVVRVKGEAESEESYEIYSSGDLHGLALAGLLLSDMAVKAEKSKVLE